MTKNIQDVLNHGERLDSKHPLTSFCSALCDRFWVFLALVHCKACPHGWQSPCQGLFPRVPCRWYVVTVQGWLKWAALSQQSPRNMLLWPKTCIDRQANFQLCSQDSLALLLQQQKALTNLTFCVTYMRVRHQALLCSMHSLCCKLSEIDIVLSCCRLWYENICP